jgi:anti-sigma regulatory factor (Ser/Thr protein kinase)
VQHLAGARRRLRRWLESERLSDSQCDQFLLAMSEAVSNAVKHGSGGDPSNLVYIEACRQEGALTGAVRDQGNWPEGQSLSSLEKKGMGLALIRALMDTVEIEHSPQTTKVRMRFNLANG